MSKKLIFSSIIGLSLWTGITAGAIATPSSVKPMEEHRNAQQTTQFQPIEQPFSHKLIVTLVGLGLISLELWWFIWSKPKPEKPV